MRTPTLRLKSLPGRGIVTDLGGRNWLVHATDRGHAFAAPADYALADYKTPNGGGQALVDHSPRWHALELHP